MPSRRSPTLSSSARRAVPVHSTCFPRCKGFCSRMTKLGLDMTLRLRAGGRRLRRSWRHGSPRMSISRHHRHRAPRRGRRPRLLLQAVRRRRACPTRRRACAVHHDDQQLFAHLHAIRCECDDRGSGAQISVSRPVSRPESYPPVYSDNTSGVKGLNPFSLYETATVSFSLLLNSYPS